MKFASHIALNFAQNTQTHMHAHALALALGDTHTGTPPTTLAATNFKPDSNYLHRYKCAMHAGVAEYA